MIKKSENILFSVIIPTYKDWKRLSLCLQALEKQSLSKDCFEIIVVNNNPSDAIPDNYRIPLNARILTETTPGSYAARNLAIQLAKGEVLAFTDSDCIPDVNWLKNAEEIFKDDTIQRIGGKVRLFYKNPDHKTLAELYESVFAFNQRENVKKLKLSVTANFFARKELFTTVGLFDSTKMSGEDWGWNRRASAQGVPITYGSDVVVAHPARHQLAILVKKTKRVAGGQYIPPRFIKRCSKFIRLFIDRFLHPVKTVFQSELTTFRSLKVISVVFYLYVVYAFEYLKLVVKGRS